MIKCKDIEVELVCLCVARLCFVVMFVINVDLHLVLVLCCFGVEKCA